MSVFQSFFRSSLFVALLALTVGLLVGGTLVAWQGREPADSSPAASSQATGDSSTAAASSASGLARFDENGDGVVYQGGMHPDVVQDEPGSCPICGMQLTPVQVGGEGATEEGAVRISPATLQNIGVRTAEVSVEPLSRRIRTTGRFEANERRMTAVSPKVSGWVDRLHVDYEGARVQAGEPLFEIYSPELVATQEEYLTALRAADRLEGDAGAQRLVDAARRRLAYWDISEAQIERLKETREPRRTLTLSAPASGTVTRKAVTQGEKVSAGQTLMHITNLRQLWLMVDVYEQDVSWVDVGNRAEVQLPYAPGRTVEGQVDYIYDEVNPDTRKPKRGARAPWTRRAPGGDPGAPSRPGAW